MITELGEKFTLIQIPVFITVCLFNKLQNIVIADVDIQILIEYVLDIVKAHKAPFFSVKKCKQIKGLFLSSLAKKPFFCDHFNNLTEGKVFLIFVIVGDFVFDFLAVHFGEGEVTQDGSELYS